MAKSKKDLLAEAKKLDIELTGEESNQDIQEAIKIKKEELKAGENNTTPPAGDDNKEVKGKGFFYFVKVKCYKNGEERVDAGFYKTKTRVERFDRISDEYVECFEGKIKTSRLYEIAKTLKVSILTEDGEDNRSNDDILKDLAKTL